MTEQVRDFLELFRAREYRARRTVNENFDLTELVSKEHPLMADTVLLEEMLRRETPNLLPGDMMGFNRSLVHTPYYINASGRKVADGPGNNTPNYGRIINAGFEATLEDLRTRREKTEDSEKKRFYTALERDVLAVLDIAERYRVAAEEQGYTRLAEALKRVPAQPAESFYEACVFFKILVFTLRCSQATHLTIGRFDQYMYPYFAIDRARGVSDEDLFETLEMLFISLNMDGDIYFGVQQGDNGQSMVLGGYDKDGNDMFNDLSMMCMQASLELSLIDPKINLRVSKRTPDWMYELGTKLTKQGLGFPQYCNDDVIVPYMISLGYDEEDAYNYTVAACWEVLSPNNGMDIPNRSFFRFPTMTRKALFNYLPEAESFDALMEGVRAEINKEADLLCHNYSFEYHPENYKPRYMYLSLLTDGCLEKGRDVTQGGAKYNNFGVLGVGISCAADSLAAVKKTVFEDGVFSAAELLEALENDFEGREDMRHILLDCPKMGNNDEYVDSIASELINMGADALHGRHAGHFGGVWRMGTGSAQGYIRASRDLGATPDGRHAGVPFGCSFSPTTIARTDGPLSVLQSFTKHDLSRACNGGPLTMELHDTVFRNEEGERKVSQLVKAFVMLGGHQLQLNSINRERLLDAKAHPEEYPNLIVRVWGWSGYFCELDTEYQDHIISRTEYTF